MQEKVFIGFDSIEQRNRYVCKNDINKNLVMELFNEGFIYVSEIIQVFESITDPDKYIIVKTGSLKNQNKQRRTKFVKKGVLYNEICEFIGLPDSYKIQI